MEKEKKKEAPGRAEQEKQASNHPRSKISKWVVLMEKEGTKGQFYPAQQIQRKKISLKGEKLKKKKRGRNNWGKRRKGSKWQKKTYSVTVILLFNLQLDVLARGSHINWTDKHFDKSTWGGRKDGLKSRVN